jgi:hypothetical protein
MRLWISDLRTITRTGSTLRGLVCAFTYFCWGFGGTRSWTSPLSKICVTCAV